MLLYFVLHAPYILHVDLFLQERGIHLHENFDIDEETRFSSVYRGEVDDSGYDEDEDILLDARNTDTFGDSSGSSRKGSLEWTGGKINNGAQVPSSSSSVVFPLLITLLYILVGIVSRVWWD